MIAPLPHHPELVHVAKTSIWFQSPELTLNDPVHFLAYAMTYCTQESVSILSRYVSDDDMRFALDHAPPGVFDRKSWCYWNVVLGRDSVPPMPTRNLDGVVLPGTETEAP